MAFAERFRFFCLILFRIINLSLGRHPEHVLFRQPDSLVRLPVGKPEVLGCALVHMKLQNQLGRGMMELN